MKFGRSIPLILFFGLLLPTFINAEPKNCAVDGYCYPFRMGNRGGRDLVVKEEKTCDDGLCYAFRCITYDGYVMHGSGCYEDFLNTCKYIDPKIKEEAKVIEGRNIFEQTYAGTGENVFVTSCGNYLHKPPSSCAQSQDIRWFGEKAGNIFGKHLKKNTEGECEYKSRPAKTKPKVECRKGGQCFTGNAQDKELIKKYPNGTCSECVAFQCGDDERLMAGEGCLEDFERICTNVPAKDMQKIKANRKDYFLFDENYMMASCSYHDNCHERNYGKYLTGIPDKFVMFFKKWYTKPDKVCKYQPLSNPEPSKQNGNDPSKPDENGSSKGEPSKQDGNENGANSIKLFGMFNFGFILFYLL